MTALLSPSRSRVRENDANNILNYSSKYTPSVYIMLYSVRSAHSPNMHLNNYDYYYK